MVKNLQEIAKNLISIEIQRDDRKYQFSFPPTTLGELYDVLSEIRDSVAQSIMDSQKKLDGPKENSDE